MKRIRFFILAVIIGSMAIIGVEAQSTSQQMTKKEARDAARAARRHAAAVEDQILYQQAIQALKDQSFVVEVDQIIFPRGYTKYVTSMTNFVYINGGQAVIQIAANNFNPGPNGLGGITVQGTPSNITMSTDKKGFTYYNFMDQGIAVSASVNIQLIGNTNRVTVTIYPNFNNNNLTLMGNLLPYNKSNIFQGQTI